MSLEFGPKFFSPENQSEKPEKKETAVGKKIRRAKELLASHDLELANEKRAEKEAGNKGERFFHLIGKTKEGERQFIKMLINKKNEEAHQIIVREIVARQALLKQYEEGKGRQFMPTEPLLDGNFNKETGEIYYLAKGFPEQAKIGLVEKDEQMAKLTPEQGRECVQGLIAMQNEIDGNKVHAFVKEKFEMEEDGEVLDVLTDVYDSYEGYKENTLKIMSMFEPDLSEVEDDEEKEELKSQMFENHGRPEDIDEILKNLKPGYKEFIHHDEETGEEKLPLWLTLEHRLKANDFRGSVNELLERFEKVMTDPKHQTEDWQFVHGDFGPKNVFYHDNGSVEFNDWGYAGLTKNKLLALVHDYGAMRSDAWNNKEYRKAMDDEMLKHFKEQGDEEAGQAVVALGILRSHGCLAGFVENYDTSKQRLEREKNRKENTEEDLRKAFELADIGL